MYILFIVGIIALNFIALYYVIRWAVEHGINASKLVNKNDDTFEEPFDSDKF
ncbi:hypothetical protein [Geomicrobium sp. JCM 19039]|uniref:hypothetical protein n=1 Tax=Geomicrobium sp. JCM 19039 TaxID=1460636 RepID=UPI00045F3D1F|nr:hypothetical protein [Geomicrobium sp. JCM 19039]GAK12497.1 hypothetical protein JCM19039_2278 [Geomicrobium sp. JCM 19039]